MIASQLLQTWQQLQVQMAQQLGLQAIWTNTARSALVTKKRPTALYVVQTLSVATCIITLVKPLIPIRIVRPWQTLWMSLGLMVARCLRVRLKTWLPITPLKALSMVRSLTAMRMAKLQAFPDSVIRVMNLARLQPRLPTWLSVRMGRVQSLLQIKASFVLKIPDALRQMALRNGPLLA